MKFSRLGAMGYIIGYFILVPFVIQFNSLRWTFNYAIHGIIGIMFAIIIGLVIGKIGGAD